MAHRMLTIATLALAVSVACAKSEPPKKAEAAPAAAPAVAPATAETPKPAAAPATAPGAEAAKPAAEGESDLDHVQAGPDAGRKPRDPQAKEEQSPDEGGPEDGVTTRFRGKLFPPGLESLAKSILHGPVVPSEGWVGGENSSQIPAALGLET